MRTTLHIGSDAFTLESENDAADLQEQILAAARGGGNYVTVHTQDARTVTVLITAATPVRFELENAVHPADVTVHAGPADANDAWDYDFDWPDVA